MSEIRLPSEWLTTNLEMIGEVVTGKTPSKKNSEYFGGAIPFIKPGDVNDQGNIEFTDEHLTELGAATVPTIPKGSIVVTCIGNLGRCAITTERSATNQQINSVLPFSNVDLKFIYYQMRTLKEWMVSESSATTVTIINKSKFSQAPLVLPPLAEQKVIAEKLDTLLAQVDNTKARLERIPEILKRFRQSVLAAAVSGKLTEKWRALSSKPNSTVSELPENNKTRRGLPDGVAYPDALEGFCFPDDWNVLSVASLLRKGVIIDLKDGNHGANHPKSSEFTQEGLPFITAAQMSDDGKIDYDGAPRVSGEPLEKLKVGFSDAGDVIYSHKGTVGRVGIAERASVLSPQTTYIRLNQKYVSNRFYALMLKSHAFTTQVDAIKSQTTRDFVPITAHYSLFAVIPQLEEQTEIVRRVEELFAFADRIEHAAQAALSRVNNLTQSILAKAFRGELTADWRAANPELISGENSAEALLAKIKTERETIKNQPKTKSNAVKKKTGSRMSKQIIKVVDALKEAGAPLSGQQLLAAAGYPSDCNTEQLEKFFLDIRDAMLVDKTIVKLERSNDSQDWFTLSDSVTNE